MDARWQAQLDKLLKLWLSHGHKAELVLTSEPGTNAAPMEVHVRQPTVSDRDRDTWKDWMYGRPNPAAERTPCPYSIDLATSSVESAFGAVPCGGPRGHEGEHRVVGVATVRVSNGQGDEIDVGETRITLAWGSPA